MWLLIKTTNDKNTQQKLINSVCEQGATKEANDKNEHSDSNYKNNNSCVSFG